MHCKPKTVSSLFQLSAKPGHMMHQVDVQKDFLHIIVEVEVYLDQPVKQV